MFATVLIYAFIFLWMRRKSRSGQLSSKAVHGATPLMVLYPLIYVICTAPLAAGRIAALAGNDVSNGYFCMAGTLIACNGWLDVLLYASTRADIVFAEYPPSEETGLDTFAFMGKGRTTTAIHADERGGSGLARSIDGDSVRHLYGNHIRINGEVTVSSDAIRPGSSARDQTGTVTSAVSANSSRSWEARSVKSFSSQ